MYPDDVIGQPQLVLDAADQPLGAQEHAKHHQRLEYALAGAATSAQQPDDHDRDTEQGRDRCVAVDYPGERAGALEREAWIRWPGEPPA